MMNREKAPLPPRIPREPRRFPILEAKEIESIIEAQCGPVRIAQAHGRGNHGVYILPEAYQEFCSMVSYGRRSPMNTWEQKYVGYGHFFLDSKNNVHVVVSHFIQIPTMNRGSVSAENLGPNGEDNPGLDFLQYYREEFLRCEARYNTDAYGKCVDPFLERCGASEFVLEGHTHPGLGVFWSATDRRSGAARAASAPVCIFVCDPIRRQMLGCIGKYFEPARVIAYERVKRGQEETFSFGEGFVDQLGEMLRTQNTQGHFRSRIRGDGKTSIQIKMVIDSERKDRR